MAKLHGIGLNQYGFETTFGGGSANYQELRLPAPFPVESLDEKYLEDDSLRVNLSRLPGQRGHKSESKLQLAFDAMGLSASTPTAQPANTDNQLCDFLAAALGHSYLCSAGSDYGVIQALSTVSRVKLDAGEGARYYPGMPILVESDGTPQWMGAVVQEVDTDDLILREDLELVPKTGGSVIAGITVHPAEELQMGSMAFVAKTLVDVWTVYGARVASLKCTGTPKAFMGVTTDWAVNNWTRVGAPDPLTYAASTWPPRQHLVGAVARFITAGGDRIALPFSTFEYDPGIELGLPPDGTNSQGQGDGYVGGFRHRFSIDVPYATEDVFDAWDSGDPVDLLVKWGTGPGRTILFTMPAARVVEFPKFGEGDKARRNKIVFEGQRYDGDAVTGTDTDPANKDCAWASL